MFGNYVDKEQAMSFYPSGTEHFQDFYNNQTFTITSFLDVQVNY